MGTVVMTGEAAPEGPPTPPPPQHDLCVLRVAHVVVEAASALSIGAGGTEGTFDMALRRDPNGLPALPGTTVAGVLRALWRHHHPELPAEEFTLFGSAAEGPGAPEKTEDARASRVEVGWGHFHDAADRPVVGPRLDGPGEDVLLTPWMGDAKRGRLTARARVRLNGRGAAADRGQFTRLVALAGSRFTFELVLRSSPEEEEAATWEKLLGLLRSPLFRIGGAVRAGLGRLSLVRLATDRFDLSDAADRARFVELRPLLHALDPAALPLRDGLPAAPPNMPVERCIRLRAEDALRIGPSGPSLLAENDQDGADHTPAQERCILWPAAPGERATESRPRLLLPASSFKGALRHRVAFHDFRLSRRWADPAVPAEPNIAAGSAAVVALFGQVKGHSGGHAGRLLIEDVLLPELPADGARTDTHVTLDRFTGGAYRGRLFTEEVVQGLEVTLRFWLLPGADAQAEQALEEALGDLCRGWLPIGAASGRGLGALKEIEPREDAGDGG